MTSFDCDMTASSCIRVAAENPETVLDRALADFAAAAAREQLLIVDFDLAQYWLEDQPAVALSALYHLRRIDGAVQVDTAVMPRAECTLPKSGAISAWLDAAAVPRFALERAVVLASVAIPKPWGQEIWYTGIERRGVAEVRAGQHRVPLPWLLAIAPRRLCANAERNLILLKILDPLPDAVFGDLYFELHRQKQEVYVVTEVDRSAWPDGVGGIRFGFNAELRRSYADDQAFLRAYVTAVHNYRLVRREIDALLDQVRLREQVGLNDPVAADTLRRWLQSVPAELQQSERERRIAMENFTGLLPLRVGDVVKVPCWVPHALQHGVRTVEFQTPVYERLILSFAQKVLTQVDWDTQAAAELLQLDPPAPAPWQVTDRGEGWVEERIVEFDDFEVRRVTLQPGAGRRLAAPDQYALCMVIGGALVLDGESLEADQAVLLPGSWRGGLVENTAAVPRLFLLAYPRTGRG
jgi:hypothetical protein